MVLGLEAAEALRGSGAGLELTRRDTEVGACVVTGELACRAIGISTDGLAVTDADCLSVAVADTDAVVGLVRSASSLRGTALESRFLTP
jgi:hypothetical protein